MKTTRRDFLITSGMALGSASLISPLSFGYGLKNKNEVESFGFQVWTIRKKLVEDFPGTLKKVGGFIRTDFGTYETIFFAKFRLRREYPRKQNKGLPYSGPVPW